MSLDVRAEPVLARGLGFVDGVPAVLVMRDGQRIAQSVGWDSEAVTAHFIGAALMSAGGVQEIEEARRAVLGPRALKAGLSLREVSFSPTMEGMKTVVKFFDPSTGMVSTVQRVGRDAIPQLLEAQALVMKEVEPL
jgi:hypothetical protein